MSSFGNSPLRGESLLITGGRIYPHASSYTEFDSMLITDGVVSELGDEDQLERLAPADVPRLELNGEVVLPGFIDAHTHVEATAFSRNKWMDARGLTPEEATERIAAAAGEITDGSWILAQGTFGQQLPSRAQIDAAAPNTPALIRESGHRLQANSRALEAAGLLHKVPRLAPGMVVHADEHGVPTGLVEEAQRLFPIPPLPRDEMKSLLIKELTSSFARRGITTIFEMTLSKPGIAAILELGEARELPTRMALIAIIRSGPELPLNRVEDWDAKDFGDATDSDLVAAGGLKIFVDGDNEQAFDTDYFNRTPRQWGAVTRTLHDLREEVIWANRHDAQMMIHAIGDLAQEFTLEAVRQAQSLTGKPKLRTRLEHAANLKLSPEILSRIDELDVIPVPTASFIATDDGSGLYAFRSLLEAGMQPPGNSDTLGSIADAPNPWFGIANMIERKNAKGVPVAPEEGVTVEDGVRMYTEFAAGAAGMSAVIGSLQIGAAADLGIYETDPRRLTPQEMRNVETRQTFVGGRLVWNR